MIGEEMLISAAGEVSAAIASSIPDLEHRFSPVFERKMERLFRQARYPALYAAARRAVAVLLAAITIFFAFYMASPKVQAAVNSWIRTVFGNYFQYAPVDTTPPDTQYDYALPEEFDGYTMLTEVDRGEDKFFIYVNEEGQMLSFEYLRGSSDPAYFLADMDTHELSQVQLGNIYADVYIAPDRTELSSIIWYSKEENVLFCISAVANQSKLISFAEKIEKFPKN